MPKVLPRLRQNLDFLPSPLSDRPGLLIRDPLQFSDSTLIVPPMLVRCLECFDGEHSDIELRSILMQLTGELQVGVLLDHLCESLASAGFFEDQEYERMRSNRMRAFAEAPVREPAHAGSAYPDEAEALTDALNGYLDGAEDVMSPSALCAIAAPHVSPEGGSLAYGAAYRALKSLGPAGSDKTFVVLGTSHYGEPEKFGLTRKPYETPLGTTRTEQGWIDRLAAKAPDAVAMEDYCHAIEHSVEFQVIFLQHLFGPDVKVLPILCGSFFKSIIDGGLPEDTEQVKRFHGELRELSERDKDSICWVLGIDMAHMGLRYGDKFAAYAGSGQMEDVGNQDRTRMNRIEEFDSEGFWRLIQKDQDPLKWCGSSPVYTFLQSAPPCRGKTLEYQQWNIDDQSVVSFAGMQFTPAL